MPIYEFKCQKCGQRFEELCRIGEDGSGLVCPGCGGSKLRRCQSAFSARSAGPGGSTSAVGGKACAPT